MQGRADGIGGGVYRAGNQAVHIILRHHHGAQYHGIFQLLASLLGRQTFAFAQLDHRLDILRHQIFGLDDFHRIRQFDTHILGYRHHRRARCQQYAACDAFFMADRSGLYGTRLGAFRQHDALIGFARRFHHIETELRGRHFLRLRLNQFGATFQHAYFAQIRQAGFFRRFGAATDYAGQFHVFAVENLLGQLQAAVKTAFFGGGKYHARIKGSGQIHILSRHKHTLGIRGYPLNHQIFCTDLRGASNQQIQPIICLAGGNQALGFRRVFQYIEYRRFRQRSGQRFDHFYRIHMRAHRYH